MPPIILAKLKDFAQDKMLKMHFLAQRITKTWHSARVYEALLTVAKTCYDFGNINICSKEQSSSRHHYLLKSIVTFGLFLSILHVVDLSWIPSFKKVGFTSFHESFWNEE